MLLESTIDANFVEDQEDIFDTMVYVEYVLEN
jgi:hypothetical protein